MTDDEINQDLQELEESIMKNNFNNGVCPHCNRKLINFDIDSQGGRGYKCDCGYQTWVSYKCVDKNFLIES